MEQDLLGSVKRLVLFLGCFCNSGREVGLF